MTSTAIAPAAISPRRPVPDSIARPEYVDRPAPAPFTGNEVKDADTIERIRAACRLAAQARDLVGAARRPGRHHRRARPRRARVPLRPRRLPSTLGYKGFPKSLCTSVNEVICHGIPDARVLEDGDIVNVDITAFLDGVHGDTNATFLAGDVDEETRLLVERTRESLDRAIKAVKPGRRVNVIGRVIEAYAKRFGYGVVREFTGHGIGTSFHSGLIIPHYDDPRFDDEIRPGMTFTIEPMLNLGTHEWVDVGRRLDRRHRRRAPQRAVRAHPAGHRRRRRGAHAAVAFPPSSGRRRYVFRRQPVRWTDHRDVAGRDRAVRALAWLIFLHCTNLQFESD